jgi:DNA-binding MarR family transcriptional regulator
LVFLSIEADTARLASSEKKNLASRRSFEFAMNRSTLLIECFGEALPTRALPSELIDMRLVRSAASTTAVKQAKRLAWTNRRQPQTNERRISVARIEHSPFLASQPERDHCSMRVATFPPK